VGGTVYERVVAPFPVRDMSGRAYELPFLGGFDVPRPQFVDIDGDGDLDLFIQERSNELIFLENVGSASSPAYRWRTDRFAELEIGEWSRFTDLDGDGDLDLLAEERFSYIRFYRNEGSPTDPRFVLVADTLRDDRGIAIFSDRQNLPNVVDIDCDGRPDLFLGRADGTVTRYEMVGSGPDGVPIFRLVTDRFQDIEIVAAISGGPPGLSYHGANSMSFADFDADGDQDMFWGDFFEPGVLLLENIGSCFSPNFRLDPVPVATASSDTLLTSGYNVAVPVDVDADGDLDLVVGVLGGAFNPNRSAADNLHLWLRGPDGLLVEQTRRYVTQIDVGGESVPALGDLDGDGDLDLLIGNKLDPAGLDAGRIYWFENRGTPTSPDFIMVDTLRLGDAYHYAPVLADLDADGDLDLIVGTWHQGVLRFRNDGSPTSPSFTATDSALVTLTRGSNATPALADVDGDGDLDMMVGEASGQLNYYRNDGTPEAPSFTLVSEEYDGMDAGWRSHPAFLDVDGDGDPDLLVGREELGLLVYLNFGGSFRAAGDYGIPLLPYAAPTFGDLDGDGDIDILVGTLSGGLVFLRAGG